MEAKNDTLIQERELNGTLREQLAEAKLMTAEQVEHVKELRIRIE